MTAEAGSNSKKGVFRQTLAHYAVRRLIHEAAGKVGEDPDRLSFLHTVNVVRRRIVRPGALPPKRTRTPESDILEEFLE